MNLNLLRELRNEGLLLRRINIRQVEGEGFQDIPEKEFKSFKSAVRDTIDSPLLQELFPLGHILKDVHWETHDGRTRLPVHLTEEHVVSMFMDVRDLPLVAKSGLPNPHWRSISHPARNLFQHHDHRTWRSFNHGS